jgi:hypothetical protein
MRSYIARPAPLALALLLSLLPTRARPELPFCAPLASGGRWDLGPPGVAPVQGAWETPGCRLRPWGPDDFRNRRVAIVGDSVSRFLMFDIASAAFGCPPLVDCNPRKCSSGIPEGAAKVASTLREPCASLYRYTYVTRLHENLYLRDALRNASVDLYWITYAEDFMRHAWVKPLFAQRSYDAFIVSVGLWDVGAKPKPEESVVPSVAHHCAWSVSHVQDMFYNSLLLANPTLRDTLLFWTTAYAEPFRNTGAKQTEIERFPHDQLDTVNRCSRMAWKDHLGFAFFNATPLLRAPAPVIELLRTYEATNNTAVGAGKLLTLDGYHPNRATRAAVVDEMMNHFKEMWPRVGRDHSGVPAGALAAAAAALGAPAPPTTAAPPPPPEGEAAAAAAEEEPSAALAATLIALAAVGWAAAWYCRGRFARKEAHRDVERAQQPAPSPPPPPPPLLKVGPTGFLKKVKS